MVLFEIIQSGSIPGFLSLDNNEEMWHLWIFGVCPILCTTVRYKISHRIQNIIKEYDILNKHYYAQVGLLIPIWNVYFRNMFDTLGEILYLTIVQKICQESKIKRCQMEKVWKKGICFYSILISSSILLGHTVKHTFNLSFQKMPRNSCFAQF